MKNIGFLGFGKIGQALYREILKKQMANPIFIQNLVSVEGVGEDVHFLTAYEEDAYQRADLIVECATADVLKDNVENILLNSDLLLFSVTAFSDEEFKKKALELADRHHRHIYIPHGAILGFDGILDGRELWEEVLIKTTKNPSSLGRKDTERTVVYEGSTREICSLYPRNVNVHAAIALLGLGFDRTKSMLISDPSVNTNSHMITLRGAETEIQIQVSSLSGGGVTGQYTPLSACGSLSRILQDSTVKIV